MFFRKIALSLLLTLPLLHTTTAHAVDLNQIQKDLAGAGVSGWIHGSVEGQGLYAFTYRNPSNFFDYVIMSLVTTDPGILKQLASFDRQDKVLVKGGFLDNPSPQKHILISSIQLVTKYDSGYQSEPYHHEANIPADLLGATSATFLVHAIGGNGQILVLEYKDAVVPMFVKNGALTQGLFRGDVVQLAYKMQSYPDHPSHLNLDDSVAQPVRVLDSIQAKNGKPAVLEGALVLFPKSPEITMNIFAVQELLPDSLSRQYTLVNFDDPNVFTQILSKLQAAWDRYPGQYVNGRNKLVSIKLKVRVQGTFNEVDPSQANAQILLKSADSIQVIE